MAHRSTTGTNKIGKILKKIQAHDYMVLVIKKDSELAQNITEVGKGINGMGLSNVLIIICDKLDDIKALPDNEMHKIGWVRFPLEIVHPTTLVTIDEIDPNAKEEKVEKSESPDDPPSE